MKTPVLSRRVYRFGLFQVEPGGKLLRQGEPVKLQEQPLRVLCLLLERPGEVVTREELRQALWPEGTYVEFDGSLNAALKRLRFALGDDADNPIFIETVPKRGYRFLAPVAIEDEPHAAEEKIVGERPLAHQLGIPEAAFVPPAHLRWRHLGLVYAACIAMALTAGLSWYWLRHLSRPVPSSLNKSGQAVPIRKSVAVLGFQNASGRPEDDWLATAISEILSAEITAGEKLRVVPGEEVANLRIASPWPQATTLGRDMTLRIGAALNSDVLVLGSYSTLGSGDNARIRLDVRLQNAQTGEVLSQIVQTDNRNNLFRVTSEIGAQLRQELGVPDIKDTEQAGILASLPPGGEGARFYSLGITRLRDFDAVAARDLLEQATKADPKFPLAHLMLSRAWAQLGYEQKRKEEAKKALDLSTDLPRIARLQVEGDYYESIPDHEKAASTYRALFELFPDNVDYGLQLAPAQNAAGHGAQAHETIARLRRLPPPASEDPRIDLAEAACIPLNRPLELDLLRSAMRKAHEQGKELLYAQAEEKECMNLGYGSHPDQAPAACEDAYSLFVAAGNRLEAADTIRLLGDAEATLGHPGEAISTYKEALGILQALGEHAKTGEALNRMADQLAIEGDIGRSEGLYRQAKFHFEQAGDEHRAALAIAGMADMLYARGKLPEAEELYRQTIAMETAQEQGEPNYAWYRLADLLLTEGRVEEAHKLAQEAVDALQAIHGNYQYLSAALNVLGDVLRAEGDSAAARQQYGAALDIAREAGEALLVAKSQTRACEIALDEGHPDQAEPLLRAAIAQFEMERADPDSANTSIELSRALLMEGKLDEARKAIQHAAKLSRASSNPALKLPISIQAVRVMLAAARQNEPGHPSLDAERQQLRAASDIARRLGYYTEECEARLALGELEIKANPKLGRSVLAQLAVDAHQRGMELVARKASALLA